MIWTKNAVNADLTTNKGYKESMFEQSEGEKRWWWDKIWALNNPLKTIINFWLAMNNKLLTWENLRKRVFQGPSICILCKSSNEQSSHLFSSCPYARDVWTTASRALTQDMTIMNCEPTLEQRAQFWWRNTGVCCFDAFPALFVYIIWDAQNKAICKNQWTPSDITSTLLVQKTQEHKTTPK